MLQAHGAGLPTPRKSAETVLRRARRPQAETKEFIDSLAKDVAWMGWAPVKTTHTSDYFGVFYELALELIKGGKAYVCHQKPAEIEACRSVAKARAALRALEASGEKPPPQVVEEARVCEPTAHESPFRDRGVDENLKLFERMRTGVCPEGECTLRLKMDATAANFNMFDQVAYDRPARDTRRRAAAAPRPGTRICRGTRRRRGQGMDMPRNAAAPRPGTRICRGEGSRRRRGQGRGYSVEKSVAATPRPGTRICRGTRRRRGQGRGYAVETGACPRYRIKHCAHPHAGDKWCIYPTYDYTHCIVDALEHVDYSICTLEFETRRESYYWVLDALDLYRPKVFEMSRLNVSHVVSRRG